MLDGVTGQSGSGMDIKLGLDILTMGFHRSDLAIVSRTHRRR